MSTQNAAPALYHAYLHPAFGGGLLCSAADETSLRRLAAITIHQSPPSSAGSVTARRGDRRGWVRVCVVRAHGQPPAVRTDPSCGASYQVKV